MSLQLRLASLISAIGADVKALNTSVTAINRFPKTITWHYGDTDPTLGGALPAGTQWILVFTADAATQPLPTWTPSGSLTVRPT